MSFVSAFIVTVKMSREQRPGNDRMPQSVSEGEHDNGVEEFRRYAVVGLALVALLFLTPFAVSDFLFGLQWFGWGALGIVMMLVMLARLMVRGRQPSSFSLLVLIVSMMSLLALLYWQEGIIGVLWTFPAVIAFYFILSERNAWIANLLLLFMAIPSAWYLMEGRVAARVTAVLLVTSIFAATFVRLIGRQQKKLEWSEKKRREGMAGISHELRTPLATLNAQVDAMLDGIRPLEREQLISVSRTVGHLNGMVDELYLLALADVGALTCKRERFDWDEVVKNAVDDYACKFRQRDMSVHTIIERSVRIEGDPARMRQILDNLLENCFRYAEEGAKVLVTLSRKGSRNILTVSDSGPGVDEYVLEALFERFFRVEGSRSRETGGAGLGLPLCRALAEAQGGTITAFHATQGGLGVRVAIPCL